VTAQRRERVREILARARALEAGEREQYLEVECGADRDLRDEVAGLLAREGVAPDFLDPLGAEAVDETLQALTLDYTGLQMGDFKLEQPIGRGATGVVHQATQLSLRRKVAVKILAPLMVSNAERLERFRREAYSQSRLRHPHVVAAFYFGSEGGVPYLAMEHVRGRSLREHMADERKRRARPDPGGPPAFDPFDARAAAALMAKVATALDYCHRQGVIHRDVKPNNILIDEQLEPRLIDFGIARDQSLETLTRSGDISGTPYYMSPEQARARKRHVSHRTDVYSAGAVLYEMLAGVPPFPGTDSLAVLQSICNDPLRPVRSIRPDVPRPLERICHKAMEKDPDLRYGTAAELAEDLHAFLAGRAIQARGPTVLRRLGAFGRAHPSARTAAAILAIVAAIAVVQLGRDYVRAANVPLMLNDSDSRELKAGIPAAVFDAMSPLERIEASKRYERFLIETLRKKDTRTDPPPEQPK
jgi:hypothetical protein